MATETATFGAGCFWGVEAELRSIPGVLQTTVGYMGGSTRSPSYEDVCSHRTGHAEVVQVEFDPQKVSYEDLVDHFWGLHDPTQVNRQGPDVGDQYRSVIFVRGAEQERAAIASREKAQSRFRRPIATEIVRAPEFWRAEEYHQRYLEKHGVAACTLGQPVAPAGAGRGGFLGRLLG